MRSLSNTKYCIKNAFSLFAYEILKVFFNTKKNNKKRDILFINTGQIGDLTVSSVILDNDNVFDDVNVYFLIKQKYLDLFRDYKGKVKIIDYNYENYKWSLFYKIKFLKFLNSLNLDKCFNLTTARGMLNDEMSLLSGANEVYCLNSNWKYLKKAFGKIMDKEYDGVLYKEKANEYEKHFKLLKGFNVSKNISIKNKKTFNSTKLIPKIAQGEYITIAPLSSDIKRSWGVENYKLLCKGLSSKYKIVLLGAESEKGRLESIKNGNDNILNTGDMYNISEIPSVIQKSVLYIGNDSGLTHIALKLDVPIIAIIGGGNYGKFFPIEEKNPKIAYLYNKMDCFGCDWDCIYEERSCLTKVTLDELVTTIASLIDFRK